jgi:hypothetical protein
MSEIAVENIDVAKVLGSEKGAESLEKVKAALEADPEVSVLMKAADTVEDVYEIVKRFSTATFEQVKVLFKKTVDYFKESKAVLSDEMLDNVSGGMNWSSFWNSAKNAIISGCIVLGCAAVGLVAGACVAGAFGAFVGAGVGTMVGAVAGLVYGEITKVRS